MICLFGAKKQEILGLSVIECEACIEGKCPWFEMEKCVVKEALKAVGKKVLLEKMRAGDN